MKSNTDVINFYEVSVSALLPETRKKLSCMLNRPKVLLSPNHHPRDYRGLGDLMGVNTLSNWFPNNDFVQNLLLLWVKEKPKESNLGKLREFFELIDRYDVLDDTHEMFVKDAVEYLQQRNEGVPYLLESSPGLTHDILTIDDVQRYQKGLPLRIYDAFLLYVKADEEFAKLLIDTLEGPRFNLHLCEKDRDFVGGIEIERSAIIKIISKRCRKLLVVLSPEFLQSENHTYFVQITQSLSYNQKTSSRVIPCLNRDCPLSDEFRAFHILDYRRANELVDFWEKLYSSIVPLGPNYGSTADDQTQLQEKSSSKRILDNSYSTPNPSLDEADDKVNHHTEIPFSQGSSKSNKLNVETFFDERKTSTSKTIMSKINKINIFSKKKKRNKAVVAATI